MTVFAYSMTKYRSGTSYTKSMNVMSSMFVMLWNKRIPLLPIFRRMYGVIIMAIVEAEP